nr:MAG TPA: hypothetical protein [Caudoviricetes sp.]
MYRHAPSSRPHSFNTPFEPTFLCVRPLPGPVTARF